MEVVLTQDIRGLGTKWDICNVKAGYFRNFLAPKGLAVIPTAKVRAEAEKHLVEKAKKLEELKQMAGKIKEQLEGVVLKMTRRVTKGGKTLYAAVTAKDIAEAIKEEKGLEVNWKQITIEEKQIKTVGAHKVKIVLAEGVTVEVAIKVEADKE